MCEKGAISPENGAPRSRPRKRWAVYGAILCMLFGAGYLLSQRSSAPSAQSKRGRSAAGVAIPVSVTAVKSGNIGVYVNALGTVTPVYTATVTSRVAGELMEVHYH